MSQNQAIARRKMVENQIRANKVTDAALLNALEVVPRERFVPAAKSGIAYVDEDLEVASGRYLMEPMVLGRLIQALAVGQGDMLLDVACATGYSTAILGLVCGTVVGVEEDPAMVAQANDLLNELSVDNGVVVEGRHAEGYAKQAPYDAILVNGAVAEVPQPLFAQLAEGGRLTAVVKTGPGLGRAMLYTKVGGLVAGRTLFDAGTPFLPGFAPAASFVF